MPGPLWVHLVQQPLGGLQIVAGQPHLRVGEVGQAGCFVGGADGAPAHVVSGLQGDRQVTAAALGQGAPGACPAPQLGQAAGPELTVGVPQGVPRITHLPPAQAADAQGEPEQAQGTVLGLGAGRRLRRFSQ